jgi:hypothetical protein
MVFGMYAILLFETLVFMSTYAILTGVTLDTTQPRLQPVPTDIELSESLAVTSISLFLLILVTWLTHAA